MEIIQIITYDYMDTKNTMAYVWGERPSTLLCFRESFR